ncbi:MAG: Trk system potassium transporter TrkA [Planctomycetota bacterium]|nr:Trk system potassium transporter TrkA [Planctomycetota bacterium]MDA1165214.1 Trk system potassium transporter TrkA [Planctomycetota bacterium]
MNIVIFGAGTVGTSIADTLCAHNHNVCLVDSSKDALSLVEERLDVRTLCGSACDSIVLFQAGVQSADLCLSVTSSDEVNLVGASLAKAMGAKRSLARIFNPAYLDTSTFDYRRHFGIDRLLSLEHLTALELARAIRMPTLFAVDNFARGGIEVQEIAVEAGSKGAGVPLKELELPKNVRIGLISSAERCIIAGANDVIEPGDHVTLFGSLEALESVKRDYFEHRPPARLNVIIAGGGEIGYSLARILQKGRFSTVLMEADADRCEYLAQRLPDTTVLHADVTRQAEMQEARVGKADIFVAATGRDEDNIVCGVEARELGCPRILSVVRRPDYANVLERLGIDVAVSPREVTSRQILGMVQGGVIIAGSEISRGDAEVWEVEIVEGSPVTKAPLKDVSLPGCLIAALVREDFASVPGADDQLRAGDTAVVLVHRHSIADTLAIFERG